jgi:hypothetical protein
MTKVEWILGGVLVILLVIVAGLAVSLWIQPGAQTGQVKSVDASVAPTPVYAGQPAMAAAVAATHKAETWQSDAVLYKASATWMQGVDAGSLNSGASAWDFTYYSPGSQALASMSVADNVTGAVAPGAENVDLSPLNVVGGWKVDSPEAVRILMEQGGRDFLAREGITAMVMTLTTENGNGRLEWLVSLFAPQTENSFSVRLDATSGDILEIIQSP